MAYHASPFDRRKKTDKSKLDEVRMEAMRRARTLSSVDRKSSANNTAVKEQVDQERVNRHEASDATNAKAKALASSQHDAAVKANDKVLAEQRNSAVNSIPSVAINISGNARQGQMYQTRRIAGRDIHDYKKGDDVIVPRSKRSLAAKMQSASGTGGMEAKASKLSSLIRNAKTRKRRG